MLGPALPCPRFPCFVWPYWVAPCPAFPGLGYLPSFCLALPYSALPCRAFGFTGLLRSFTSLGLAGLVRPYLVSLCFALSSLGGFCRSLPNLALSFCLALPYRVFRCFVGPGLPFPCVVLPGPALPGLVYIAFPRIAWLYLVWPCLLIFLALFGLSVLVWCDFGLPGLVLFSSLLCSSCLVLSCLVFSGAAPPCLVWAGFLPCLALSFALPCLAKRYRSWSCLRLRCLARPAWVFFALPCFV